MSIRDLQFGKRSDAEDPLLKRIQESTGDKGKAVAIAKSRGWVKQDGKHLELTEEGKGPAEKAATKESGAGGATLGGITGALAGGASMLGEGALAKVTLEEVAKRNETVGNLLRRAPGLSYLAAGMPVATGAALGGLVGAVGGNQLTGGGSSDDEEETKTAKLNLEKFEESIAEARKKAKPPKSQEQADAGTYPKGHINWNGMRIAIENPKGSVRSGINGDGVSWSVTTKSDYGYIKQTTGADGDHVDVFMGDNPESEIVFVINQNVGGKFDEHKVVLGCNNEADAKQLYIDNYSKGWKGFDSIRPMTLDDFKSWVFGTGAKKKAAAEAVKELKQAFKDLEDEDSGIIDVAVQIDEDGEIMQARINAGDWCDGDTIDAAKSLLMPYVTEELIEVADEAGAPPPDWTKVASGRPEAPKSPANKEAAVTKPATVGQYLLADVLPPDVYTPGQEIDKGTVKQVFGDLARNHEKDAGEIIGKAVLLGRDVARRTGGGSFTVEHMLKPPGARKRRDELVAKIQQVVETLPEEQQSAAIVALLGAAQKTDALETLKEAQASGNPLAEILKGAGRGNAASLNRLLASDLMYADSQGRPIPVPVLRSYSEELSPGELVAGAYGARKGTVEAKLSVASGGALSKLLNAASHRMIVTDRPEGEDLDGDDLRGLPVETEDDDNVGALLARRFGPYPVNTTLTPKILADLARKGHKEILVRSPITTRATNGGVYAEDVGVREGGKLPGSGEFVGITAAAAVSEPITQSVLSSKHTGGVAGEDKGQRLSGFDLIDKLFNTPKNFRDAATHSEKDGQVQSIKPAEQGGYWITVNDEKHYVPKDVKPIVEPGQRVEAGDRLSEGVINPRKVIEHKGLGEGARQLTYELRQAIRDSGTNASARNLQLVVAGLVNRVRMTKEFGDHVPDDIVPYNEIARDYMPREGFKVVGHSGAKGMYLEKPVLHYTIGTRVTPSVVNRLKQYGVGKVTVHKEPPPFQSEMVRASDLLKSDQDWATRHLGTGLGKSTLESVHRGRESDPAGTSFVPARIEATNFGKQKPFKVDPPDTAGLRLGHQ